jgi:hypothetical protein
MDRVPVGFEQIEHQRKRNAGQLMAACEKGQNETVRGLQWLLIPADLCRREVLIRGLRTCNSESTGSNRNRVRPRATSLPVVQPPVKGKSSARSGRPPVGTDTSPGVASVIPLVGPGLVGWSSDSSTCITCRRYIPEVYILIDIHEKCIYFRITSCVWNTTCAGHGRTSSDVDTAKTLVPAVMLLSVRKGWFFEIREREHLIEHLIKTLKGNNMSPPLAGTLIWRKCYGSSTERCSSNGHRNPAKRDSAGHQHHICKLLHLLKQPEIFFNLVAYFGHNLASLLSWNGDYSARG